MLKEEKLATTSEVAEPQREETPDTAVSSQVEDVVADPIVGDEPEYTPNYKFKVLDQEKEFDEFMRPHVTKDNEKLIRELYEKAHGLDHVKSQRDTERVSKAEVEGRLTNLMSQVQELGQIKDKDLGMFFHKIGIPKQQVAKWVLEQADVLEAQEKLPDNLKGIYNKFEELQLKTYEQDKQIEALSSRGQAEALQAKRADLSSTLSDPSFKSVAESFDTRLGKPGSFEQLVIRHGAAEYEASGGKRDLSAAQAAQEVIQMIGLTPPSPSKESGTKDQPRTVVTAKPATLPNVGTGTGTPTAKAPVKSIADLRAIAKQMNG